MKLLLLIGVIFMSQNSTAQILTITVNDIEVNKAGNIVVFLFTEHGFPKQHQYAVASETQKTENHQQQFTLTHQLEHFAVKVLHDENGDGKVTKNWTGIYPHDGLAFSNQQTLGLLGPPTYQQCQLKSKNKQTIHVSIKYP